MAPGKGLEEAWPPLQQVDCGMRISETVTVWGSREVKEEVSNLSLALREESFPGPTGVAGDGAAHYSLPQQAHSKASLIQGALATADLCLPAFGVWRHSLVPMPQFIRAQGRSEFSQRSSGRSSVWEEKGHGKTEWPCDPQLQGHFGPGIWVEGGVGGQGGYIHRTSLPAFFSHEMRFPGNLWVSIARAWPQLSGH